MRSLWLILTSLIERYVDLVLDLSLLHIERKKDKHSLVIHISDGSVTASLVHFSSKNLPDVLYTKTNFLQVGESLDTNLLFLNTQKALSLAIEDTLRTGLNKSKKKKIDKVLVTFSSPWFYSLSKKVTFSQSEPFYITEKTLVELAEKEALAFKTKKKKELPQNALDSFVVIERTIVNTKINGYSVEKIINKKVKSFEADVWISLIPESVEKTFLKIIQKHTHILNESVIAHSFPLVLSSVVRDCFLPPHSYLLVDITSETTHISYVAEGIIINTITIPIGKNYIVRLLSKNTGITVEIAESYLELYIDNRLDEATTMQLDQTITSIEKEWSIYFEEALLSFSDKLALPKVVFMTGEDSVSKIFSTFMQLPKEDRTKNWRKDLKLTYLNGVSLSGFYKSRYPREIQDSVIIETIFYDRNIKFKINPEL